MIEKIWEIKNLEKDLHNIKKENISAWEAYYKESYILALIDKLKLEIEIERLERDLWFEKYMREKDNKNVISMMFWWFGVWVIVWIFICDYLI